MNSCFSHMSAKHRRAYRVILGRSIAAGERRLAHYIRFHPPWPTVTCENAKGAVGWSKEHVPAQLVWSGADAWPAAGHEPRSCPPDEPDSSMRPLCRDEGSRSVRSVLQEITVVLLHTRRAQGMGELHWCTIPNKFLDGYPRVFSDSDFLTERTDDDKSFQVFDV